MENARDAAENLVRVSRLRFALINGPRFGPSVEQSIRRV